MDRLKGALDTIDIVVAFLSSGGGKADKSLGWYIEHTLKMRGQFCEKVSGVDKKEDGMHHTINGFIWETP